MKKTTGDQQLVKRINRSVLLRLVRSHPGLSRAQLAQHSGLTKSTVGVAVRELLEEGWLVESELSSGGQGRPSMPLHISDQALGLVGIEVAVDCIRVVAVSLLGEVLWSHETPLSDTQPAFVCRLAAGLAAQAAQHLEELGLKLTGIGLGLPGAFEESTGLLRFAPNLGWRDDPVAARMTGALQEHGLHQVPLHLQNEADAAALSEYEFVRHGVLNLAGEVETLTDALVFVTCDVGVGAGIVLDDRLYTGAQGMAGEIGHTILQIDGPLCSCGRRGCAEAFIGARALQGEDIRRQSAPDVHAHPTRALQAAGRALGVVLQNLWTTFNPGVLVLGGRSCVLHPELLTIAQQTLDGYAAAAGMVAPKLLAARYGQLAAAVGAAAMVLHHDLRPLRERPQAVQSAPSPQTPHLPTGTQAGAPEPDHRELEKEAPHVSWH